MFHKHFWVPTKVNNSAIVPQWFIAMTKEQQELYPDVGDPITTVLYVCKHCGDARTEKLNGRWSLQDLIIKNDTKS